MANLIQLPDGTWVATGRIVSIRVVPGNISSSNKEWRHDRVRVALSDDYPLMLPCENLEDAAVLRDQIARQVLFDRCSPAQLRKGEVEYRPTLEAARQENRPPHFDGDEFRHSETSDDCLARNFNLPDCDG